MSSDLPGFFQGTEMPDAMWWQALFPNPAHILTEVGLAPGMDVVDLCCGDGWFTLQMAKIARHVMAVDIDVEMLAHARTRLARDRISNCDYQLGDAYGLADYVPRPVDLVFMANSFHGVPDRARLACIVGEVLKPGERFAIVNWHQLPREKTTVLDQPRGPFRVAAVAGTDRQSRRSRRAQEHGDRRYSALPLRRDFRQSSVTFQ